MSPNGNRHLQICCGPLMLRTHARLQALPVADRLLLCVLPLRYKTMVTAVAVPCTHRSLLRLCVPPGSAASWIRHRSRGRVCCGRSVSLAARPAWSEVESTCCALHRLCANSPHACRRSFERRCSRGGACPRRCPHRRLRHCRSRRLKPVRCASTLLPARQGVSRPSLGHFWPCAAPLTAACARVAKRLRMRWQRKGSC